jgi:hypothetical protein
MAACVNILFWSYKLSGPPAMAAPTALSPRAEAWSQRSAKLGLRLSWYLESKPLGNRCTQLVEVFGNEVGLWHQRLQAGDRGR